MLVILLVSLGVIIGACAPATPAPETVFSVVTEGELSAGEAVPEPEGGVILTMTGKIGTTNADGSLQFDLATLESLGLVDYTVDDPFENREVTYRGILLGELLDVAAVEEDAVTLHTVAINDYAVDIPIAEVRRTPVFLALQANGEYMPISEKGPAMVVFPYNDFEFDRSIFDDYWIWQLAVIDVQ
jgi:hypothetical protein